MAGNDFEKQVSSRIKELRVQPSPAVWENVEVLIKKQKRRRWGTIFFIFFAILSGAGLLLINILKNTEPTALAINDSVNNSIGSNNTISKIVSSLDLVTKDTSDVKQIGQKQKSPIQITSSKNILIHNSSAITVNNSNPRKA